MAENFRIKINTIGLRMVDDSGLLLEVYEKKYLLYLADYCQYNALILDVWLSACYSCINWLSTWSNMFQVNFGVRQGSVLSPSLFAVYLDDLAKSCHTQRNIFIILYADDILLLAPSVCELDALLKVCERELTLLDMAINPVAFALDLYRIQDALICAPRRVSVSHG